MPERNPQLELCLHLLDAVATAQAVLDRATSNALAREMKLISKSREALAESRQVLARSEIVASSAEEKGSQSHR
jgi:hypothetical protein